MSAISELRPLAAVYELLPCLVAAARMIDVMSAIDVEEGFGLLKQVLPMVGEAG